MHMPDVFAGFRSVVVGTVLCSGSPFLVGQFNSATLGGTAVDRSGAVLAGARITVLDSATALQRETESDATGSFFFPVLPPGTYVLTAQHDGFAVSQTENILLHVADKVALRVEMKPGSVSESVNVSEQSAGVHTDSETRVSQLIQAEVETLPNQARDITALIRLGAGVQTLFSPRGGASLVTLSIAQASPISANGGRSKATATQLDYTDANDWEFGGIALATQPTPDMLAEVKVLTNNWSAEYGTKSNAEVVMVTRSGTNGLHGAAYDYLQNAALNARDYFDTTGRPTPLVQNQFGFAVGAPLVRNRSFVFGSYEQRETRGSSSAFVATVPSPAAVANVTDPTVRQLLALLPPPRSLNSGGQTGTLSVQASSPAHNKQFLLRVDHSLNRRNTLTARFFQSVGSAFNRTSNSLPDFDATFNPKGRNALLADTFIVSSRMVNDARVAYGRSSALFTPQDPTTPRFSVTGLVGFGTVPYWPQGRTFDVYQGNDVLSLQAGRHSIKTGFDLRFIQDNSLNNTDLRGTYTFASTVDFLAGNVASYTQTFGNTYRGYRTQYHAVFIEDDVKISPSFTANLGFRYEVQGGLSEVHRLQSVLDPSQTGTAIGNAGTGVLGAFRTASPVVAWHPNLFGPRVGFAWSPSAENGLVVRGGFGVYYDSFLFNGLQAGRTTPPSNYSVALNGSAISGGNSFANLYSGTATIQRSTTAQIGSFGALTNLGTISSTDPKLRNPYVYQYSFGVQQQLGAALFDIAYVGTKGTRLPTYGPANSVAARPAGAVSLADEQARLAAFQAAFARQNGPGNTRLDPRFNDVSLVQSAGASSYNSLQVTAETRSYHGWLLRAAYTWSKSLDSASDYTPAQSTNDTGFAQNQFNLGAERALSSYDVPHRLTLSHVWQIPGFAGRRDLLGEALGGWSFESIDQWQVGIPYTVLAGPRLGISDTNLDGNLVNNLDNARAVCNVGGAGFTFGHPNTIPAPGLRGVGNNMNSANFRYTQPLLGNDGNCRRNSERENNLLNFDWTVGKRFVLTEKGPLESGPLALNFRTDFFNVFNTAFLTASGSDFRTLSSPNFGLYNAAGSARRMQMVLRLEW